MFESEEPRRRAGALQGSGDRKDRGDFPDTVEGLCADCGVDLVECVVDMEGSAIRVWSSRLELPLGLSWGRYTRLELEEPAEPLGWQLVERLAKTDAPPEGQQYQSRGCPRCGLLWLEVRSPETLRPEQPGEVIPSEAPQGTGRELAPPPREAHLPRRPEPPPPPEEPEPRSRESPPPPPPPYDPPPEPPLPGEPPLP